MVASLTRLIAEWTLRRSTLQALASDRAGGNHWLHAVRVRVLSFLLARYAGGHRPHAVSPRAHAAPLFAPATGTFCGVHNPADHPPRPSRLLAARLHEIARCNASRRRWRFWP
jgi:hypothetical protein